ncbi:hypothetical protein DWW46_07890 [Sutterella sp. AF15-45LB]|nr:hypothetical protein DWW46_07890 [Sutterella sp. AF15-45LB]RGU77487.1 hypothetical protein DWW45_07895 [Sutterella sp. AF15-44LB]RHH05720.1 hypothetical protein DW229_07865 [Sutterella sp. AM18-8-1]
MEIRNVRFFLQLTRGTGDRILQYGKSRRLRAENPKLSEKRLKKCRGRLKPDKVQYQILQ